MISVLRGRSYKFDEGLTVNSSDWYVVGVVDIPTRIDKVWDWRNPSPNIRPVFYSTSAYMCLPATFDGTSWNPTSNEVSFVPLFSVESIQETMDAWRTPSIVEAPRFYFNDEIYSIPAQQITSTYSNWYIEEIHTRPLRIDRILDWRDLKDTEEPFFVLTDAGVGVQATQVMETTELSTLSIGDWTYNINDSCYNIPMFLVTKVYEWRSTSVSGPQGPLGLQGIQGPQGPQGPSSTSASGGGGAASVVSGGGGAAS
jgi:hypothetical protein